MDATKRFEAICKANDSDHVGLCRELCEAFLRDYPDHGPTLLILSVQLTVMRLYAEAEQMLERAEKVVPESRRQMVWSQWGKLFQAQGRLAEAEAAFLRAHSAAPDDATYLIYAGVAASDQGEIERALEHYTKATQCREGCVDETYFNRGGKLLTLKRYPEAIEAYRKALRIDPGYKQARKKLQDLDLLLSRVDQGYPT